MVGMSVRKIIYLLFCPNLILVSRAKEKRRKAFDEEWGSVNTEGNIWWRGSPYQEWQDVMGKRWLGWICELCC